MELLKISLLSIFLISLGISFQIIGPFILKLCDPALLLRLGIFRFSGLAVWFLVGNVFTRVDKTNLKLSDPNSEPQGITNYDIEVPCKILDHSDQFGPGPHPPLGGRG